MYISTQPQMQNIAFLINVVNIMVWLCHCFSKKRDKKQLVLTLSQSEYSDNYYFMF